MSWTYTEQNITYLEWRHGYSKLLQSILSLRDSKNHLHDHADIQTVKLLQESLHGCQLWIQEMKTPIRADFRRIMAEGQNFFSNQRKDATMGKHVYSRCKKCRMLNCPERDPDANRIVCSNFSREPKDWNDVPRLPVSERKKWIYNSTSG